MKKQNAFSYHCIKISKFKCSYLLTIPIEGNYDPVTFKCTNILGAFQASSLGHSEQCKKNVANAKQINQSLLCPIIQPVSFAEWNSDITFLEEYIRNNLKLMPSTIETKMREYKQKFSLTVIKNMKRKVLEECYPKETKIAFHPSNCKTLGCEGTNQDNLFRKYGQFALSPLKKQPSNEVIQSEYYIFATRLMLYQLSISEQWFLDGTFNIAPSGFNQVLTIIVHLPSFQIFYPACFILMTNKSERAYFYAFRDLISVALEQGFQLKPTIVMSDFENGLRNAIYRAFSIQAKNIIGCYFHYVQCLIRRARSEGLLKRNDSNKEIKVLLGLLKLISHCALEHRINLFQEIEEIFKNSGNKMESFLRYFKKNWLQNTFLQGLVDAYSSNTNISFIRTNNPCELFHKYLGKI